MDMALAEGQKKIGRRPKKSWSKAKNALAEGQSPPKELEVSPRSWLYLLVNNIYLLLGERHGIKVVKAEKKVQVISKCILYPPGKSELSS